MEKKRIRMKSAQYQVWFIKSIGILHPLKLATLVDPVLQINTFNKTLYSKLKKSVGTQQNYWNQHFYFNHIFDNTEDIEAQKIKLELFDHNLIRKNQLIGSYVIDIHRVYQRQNHCINYQWFGLTNPNCSIGQAKGYIQLCISCINQQDQPAQFKKPKQPQQVVNIPSSISRQTRQVEIRVFRGKSFRKTDLIGSIDPYLTFQLGCIQQLGNMQAKTSVKKNDQNPQWGQQIRIPYIVPRVNDTLFIGLWDANAIGKNQKLGTYKMQIRDMQKGIFQYPKWLDIFGTQRQSGQQKYLKIYQDNPTLAPFWCGQILLSCKCTKFSQQQLSATNIPQQQLQKYSFDIYHLYFAKAIIFYGMNLPQKKDTYKVVIQVGPLVLQTSVCKSKNGFCSWHQQIGSSFQIPSQPQYVSIQLRDTSNTILSFKKFKVKTVQPSIHQFQINKAILDSLYIEKGGYFKICFCIQKVSKKIERFKLKKRNQIQEGMFNKDGRVVGYIYQAKGLMSADIQGKSDPFIHLTYMRHTEKTHTVQNTLNPIFNSVIQIFTNVLPPHSSPPILIQVFDEDVVRNEFLGNAVVSIQEGIKQGYFIYGQGQLKPKWIKIRCGGQQMGQVLLGVRFFINKKQIHKVIPKEIQVQKQQYELVIKILSVKNIKSDSLFSVKRPFLRFDMNSIRINKKMDYHLKEQVQTSVLQNGKFQQIQQKYLTSETVRLPTEICYWPHLSVLLYDRIINKIYQPLLGSFSISLPDYFQRSFQPESLSYLYNKRLPTIRKQVSKWQQIVRYPEYIYNQKEEKVIEKQIKWLTKDRFQELGYDQISDIKNKVASKSKHYRLILDKRLQESQFLPKLPLDEIKIFKGKKHPDFQFFQQSKQQVGLFKGLILINRIGSQKHKSINQILQKSHKQQFNQIKQIKVRLLLYIIRAMNLQAKDQDSNSDPYIVVRYGEIQKSYKEKYQQDQPNPLFYQTVQMEVDIGKQLLQIQVWDHNHLLPDQLIGRCQIDLQNRYYSPYFQNMVHKPLETITLKTQISRMAKGKIVLFLEMHQLRKEPLVWNIKPKPSASFQLRLIIWRAEDYELAFSYQASDLYVKARIGQQEQQTDIHFRSMDGSGYFNYRLVFSLTLPHPSPFLHLFLLNKNLLSSNSLSQCTIDLCQYFSQAFINNKQVIFYRGQQLVNQEHNSKKQVQQGVYKYQRSVQKMGKIQKEWEERGEIQISARIMPEGLALRRPCGVGRSSPNQYPTLPKPNGRWNFSLNPFHLNKKIKYQIICLITLAVIGLLCYSILTSFFGSFLSNTLSQSLNNLQIISKITLKFNTNQLNYLFNLIL